jgi:acetyl esterase/lipase
MSLAHTPQAFASAPPPAWSDSRIDVGLPAQLGVRLYGLRDGPGAALVIHFHGGAFVSGTLDSGIATARLLVAAGAVVLSVDYPLASAEPFPAAVEAGYAALSWAFRARTRLAGPRARLFVAGEEAGGNLAAASALIARDRGGPPLAGQILLSPMLDPCLGTASLRRNRAGAAGCPLAEGWCKYLREPAAAEHPYAAPGRSVRLAGLPPALLVTAHDDPLQDETRAYAAKLRAAGVPVAECVLAAPTGWPGALGIPAGEDAPWSEPVRRAMREFLAAGATPAACERA